MTEQNEVQKSKPKVNKFLFAYFIGTIVIFAVVSLGFATHIAGAKDYYRSFRDHGPFGFMIEKVIKDLDLNDGQKKEMDIIHEEIKAKMESNKQNRDNDFNEFANLFKQDKLDKAQLTALADKHEGNREEIKSFNNKSSEKGNDIKNHSLIH